MEPSEPTVVRIHEVSAPKRVSWGAIFGGTFVALAIMVLLGSLGIAIGAMTIDPRTGDTPSAEALGIGAGIWWVVSGIIALFAGGWAAGRLTELHRHVEGTLHGFVTWSFTVLVSFVLTMTVVGSMISGAMRIMGATASAAIMGTGAVAGQVGEMIDAERGGDTWQDVRREAEEILRQTGKRQLQPENIEGDIEEARRQAEQATEAETSRQAINELEQALSQLYASAQETIAAADREAVVNVLVARTDLSRREAQDVVDRWSERFQNVWQQTAEGVRGAAASAAQATADAVAQAAWWSFFYLLLTAMAAMAGGYVGTLWPRREQGDDENVHGRSVVVR